MPSNFLPAILWFLDTIIGIARACRILWALYWREGITFPLTPLSVKVYLLLSSSLVCSPVSLQLSLNFPHPHRSFMVCLLIHFPFWIPVLFVTPKNTFKPYYFSRTNFGQASFALLNCDTSQIQRKSLFSRHVHSVRSCCLVCAWPLLVEAAKPFKMLLLTWIAVLLLMLRRSFSPVHCLRRNSS